MLYQNKGQILGTVRNPLTIIALFVFLVEGVAALSMTSTSMTDCQRWWFVVFCTVFPAIVFIVFSLIVVFKRSCLYGPSDYKDEKTFERLLRDKKMNDEVIEALTIESPRGSPSPSKSYFQMKNKIQCAVNFAIKKMEKQYGMRLRREVISDTSHYFFDAVGEKKGQVYRFEVKYCSVNKYDILIVKSLERFFIASSDGAINIVTIVSEQKLDKHEQDLFKEEITKRYFTEVVFYSLDN